MENTFNYYEIFFFFFTEYKVLTTNLTTAVRNLEACETYMFAVGLYGDFGAGPLSPPVNVSTHYNARAAPKRLRVIPSEKSEEVIVSWSSSCPRMDKPINYTVLI